MKLIVTLGATVPNFKHKYFINEKFYDCEFSFLALKEHFDIKDKDIYIIGTAFTKEKIGGYLEKYNFVKVDENNFEEVFSESIKLIEKGDIIDLTQSFRSLSFGALLAYHFTKTIGKKVKDIYYAQVRDGKNPVKEMCEFDFVSLKKYDDITDLLRNMNMFLSSWYVRGGGDFIIEKNLHLISKKLMVNDLNVLNEIDAVLDEIERISKKDEYKFLERHLLKLKQELVNIKTNLKRSEFLKLVEMSKMYFEKNLLLQSLTILFEGALAFLDYKCDVSYVCENKKGKFRKNGDKYKFRNCLKNKILIVRYGRRIDKNLKRKILIDNLEDFAKNLAKMDELRNNSAHVFINARGNLEDYKKEIKKYIDYFDRKIKGR